MNARRLSSLNRLLCLCLLAVLAAALFAGQARGNLHREAKAAGDYDGTAAASEALPVLEGPCRPAAYADPG